MTTAAICAFGEVSRSPSHYRGEQYDSDLGLYYLRARYYNPTTGRFMSRDAEDGVPTDPASLHKYIYAGGDPLGAIDPTGREALFQYAVKIIRKYGPQLTLLANCGRAIYSIYQLIGTALGGGVSELKFIYEYFKQVYSCAGPLAVKLFSMY